VTVLYCKELRSHIDCDFNY